MEPLAALSLAACVAQFIDFGGKILRETREVTKSGSSISVKHLAVITNDLVDINSSIRRQLTARSARPPQLSQEEQVRALT
jgi:hypothetical protein